MSAEARLLDARRGSALELGRTTNEALATGAHHTLEVGLRKRVTLSKRRWDSTQRDALKRAADPAATADLARGAAR